MVGISLVFRKRLGGLHQSLIGVASAAPCKKFNRSGRHFDGFPAHCARHWLVSWFRSSPYSDIDLLANFETKTTLGINTLLVFFRFRNSPNGDIEMLRISESGHEEGRHGSGNDGLSASAAAGGCPHTRIFGPAPPRAGP